MKKIICLIFVLVTLRGGKIWAQSMNCATATSINLSTGSACVNGTNAGALTDNTLYGNCNATPVDVVWYTYSANGSNNTFTITPGTLQNAEIIIYTGNCPTGAGAQLEMCTTASGSNVLTTTWGMTAGQQVWIGIASTTLNDGTFQLCINSTAPLPGAGNTCAQAIPMCNLPFSHTTMAANSSGQKPNCFASAPQKDIWVQFTVTQNGALAWTATPTNGATEFDWCVWDISSGCPGTVACCNYNYAGGSSSGFGMQNSGGNKPCGTSGAAGASSEFSPTMNVTCGKTYAIQISNYSNTNAGFTLDFTNSTCAINSNATFTVSPTLICGASLTAVINDGSTGDCAAVWDYGDGSANYTGGTPPNHTYNTPGTYAITETIGGACPSLHTEFVELLAPLAATVTPTPVNCAGQCTGSASVTAVTGGDGIYTYTWSPGGSTASTVSSLCPGTYSLSVHNAKCNSTITQTVNIIAPPALTVTPTFTNASCGNNNGIISVSGSGGTPTYSYNINGGAYSTTTTYSSLAAGTYTVGIKDSKGCTTTNTVTIANTALPIVTATSATMCPGATSTLTAGGANTYTWSPATGLSSTTGASVTCSVSVTTTYTVTGTSVGGCTATATSTVTIGGSITPTASSATICTGSSATLTATGGTTYTWSPGTGLSSTTGANVTASPTASITYTITAASGGCTGTVTSAVTVNPLPIVTANSATICAGQQTATLTAGGATTFTWSPSTGLSSSNGSPVTANPASTTSYTVTGTNANGCVSSATTTVIVNPLPVITVNGSSICNGGSTTLTAGGATTYSWSPGTGLSSTSGSSVTANPSTTTQYTVIGVDGNGCINGDTATVTVVTNPVISASTGTICVGQQTATLTANGANTYTWSPATGLSSINGSSVTANPPSTTAYTITGTIGTCTAVTTTTVTVNALPTVTATSGTICIGQGTATLTANGAATYSWSPATGLNATNGSSVSANPNTTTTYTIIGTDVNGCINSATSNVTVNQLPVVSANSATVCPGFSATLNAAGATSYTWNTGATTPSITVTPASTTSYTVGGTDANGCVSAGTATVTVNPNLVVTAGSNSPICAGAVLTLTCNPGVSWVWSGPNGFTSNQQNPTISPATATMTGTYSVTATDANGCTGIAKTNLTVNPLPVVTIGSNSPVCVNGTLNLTSGGGTGYAWSGPNNFSSLSQNPSITGVTVAAGGIYTVAVVDVNLCANTATISVTVNPLPNVTATGATVCVNATINLSTCNCGVNYSWSGPGYNSGQQNPSIPNATTNMAGTYIVTVTDINGCVNANVAQVVVNPLPTVTVSSATICAGIPTTLNATGASTYVWSPSTGLSSSNGSSVSANPATTTNYTVTGTDANGCQNFTTLSVKVNPAPQVSVSPQNISGCAPVCVNFSNTASSTGNCSWNFGDGKTDVLCAPNHCYNTQGSYSVSLTLTDTNGCVKSSSAMVTVYPMPHAEFNETPQPTSILDPLIHFYDASSGATITSWNWSFGDSTNSISTLQNPSYLYGEAGTYPVQLIVTTNNGCIDSTIVYITIDEEFVLFVPNAFSPNSDGTNDIFYAKGEGVHDFKMYIFDRWGQQVFYSDNIYKGWDGSFQAKSTEIVQEDVYVWKIEAKNGRGEKKSLLGHVSVIK